MEHRTTWEQAVAAMKILHRLLRHPEDRQTQEFSIMPKVEEAAFLRFVVTKVGESNYLTHLNVTSDCELIAILTDRLNWRLNRFTFQRTFFISDTDVRVDIEWGIRSGGEIRSVYVSSPEYGRYVSRFEPSRTVDGKRIWKNAVRHRPELRKYKELRDILVRELHPVDPEEIIAETIRMAQIDAIYSAIRSAMNR